MRRCSACSLPGTRPSSASISRIARSRDRVSRRRERGLRCSVGEGRRDRTRSGPASGRVFLFPSPRTAFCAPRAPEDRSRLTGAAASGTLSSTCDATRARGQSFRTARPTCAAKDGCARKTLPAGTNWMRTPGRASRRAQAAAFRASCPAASAKMSAASLSRRLRAAKTSAARRAISSLSAVRAQSIKSPGSLSCSARSRRRPRDGQTPRWS